MKIVYINPVGTIGGAERCLLYAETLDAQEGIRNRASFLVSAIRKGYTLPEPPEQDQEPLEPSLESSEISHHAKQQTEPHPPEDPEGFRSGQARLGPSLGARRTGVSVYELPPRQAVCPYHYEYGEEEWVLVLQGHPVLRTPEGTVDASTAEGPRLRLS